MINRKRLVRIILRPDGCIHIAFNDITTIQATTANLIALFSDPMDFIVNGRKKHKETTDKVNRARSELDDILGLTLASINEDKQIVCDFPELFSYLFANADTEEKRNRPIGMQDYTQLLTIPDEKAYLLRFYLEFTQNLKSRVAIKRNIKLRDEVQFAIIKEILNTYFEESLPKPQKALELSKQISASENENMYKKSDESPEANMVTVTEYVRINNISRDTVFKYLKEKRFKSAVKLPNGQWRINKTEIPVSFDRRRGRKRKNTGEEKFFKRALEGSPEEVRAYIQKRNIFSDDVGKYILTYAEVEYYEKNNYHEVIWLGRHALIIDVNPDYIVPNSKVPTKIKKKYENDPQKQFKNRDLMKEGFAPVVPQKTMDNYRFHIHHIGQKADSPFCIIPEYEHTSKDLSSIFHQGTPDKNLDRPEFEVQKSSFWRQYILEYDEAGRYNNIPFINHKSKRGYAKAVLKEADE